MRTPPLRALVESLAEFLVLIACLCLMRPNIQNLRILFRRVEDRLTFKGLGFRITADDHFGNEAPVKDNLTSNAETRRNP